MSTNRRLSPRCDNNQKEILDFLRCIPGVSVEPNHSDILVGRTMPDGQKKNFWFELKTPDCVSKKTGEILPSQLKPSQVKLLRDWRGHYSVVWNIEQILKEIGL